MKDELYKSVLEAVESNLPQATADNLKKLLEERENAIKDARILEAKLEKSYENNNLLVAENKQLKALDLDLADVVAQRRELEENKRDFRVERAEFKLEEAALFFYKRDDSGPREWFCFSTTIQLFDDEYG